MTLSILLLVAGVWMPVQVYVEPSPENDVQAAILLAGALLLGPTLFLFGVARLMGWAT